jgi:hypothetical protein
MISRRKFITLNTMIATSFLIEPVRAGWSSKPKTHVLPALGSHQKAAMTWFVSQFKSQIEAQIKDTAFNLAVITAIAMQETYYIWGSVYATLPVQDVLGLCVSDTIDADGGRAKDAFPKDKKDLLSAPNGAEMFTIARAALIDLNAHVAGFKKAVANPNKFCHGYGIFQYDLQYFHEKPSFFLEKRWSDFDECLKLFISELKIKYNKYFKGKTALTHEESVYLAVAYNQGTVNLNGSFKQGHKDDGVYYGENIWRYLQFFAEEK